MKKFSGVLLVLVTVFAANFAFAGGTDIDNRVGVQQGQNQEQKQWQGTSIHDVGNPNVNNQVGVSNEVGIDASSNNSNTVTGGKQVFSVQSTDNSRSLGSLPQAYTHGAQMAIFPLTENGHLIEQFSAATSVQLLPELTYKNFKIFVDTLDEEGVENWKAVNKKIKTYPTAVNMFNKLADDERVWFPTLVEFFRILPYLRLENVAAVYLYDTRFDKDKKIPVPYLQMKSLSDSVRKGGNICAIMDQFWQAHFLPEGWDLSIGGVLSGIAKNFLSGGSAAGNAAIARGQNMVTGNAGVAAAFFRVDDLKKYRQLALAPSPPKKEEMKQPPAPPQHLRPVPEKPRCDIGKIQERIREKESIPCPNLNYANFERNIEIADMDIEAFMCIGDKTFLEKLYVIEATNTKYNGAVGHFERAEKSYRRISGSQMPSNEEEILDQKRYLIDSSFKEKVDRMMAESYRKWLVAEYKLGGTVARNKLYYEKRLLMNRLGITSLPTDFATK